MILLKLTEISTLITIFIRLLYFKVASKFWFDANEVDYCVEYDLGGITTNQIFQQRNNYLDTNFHYPSEKI